MLPKPPTGYYGVINPEWRRLLAPTPIADVAADAERFGMGHLAPMLEGWVGRDGNAAVDYVQHRGARILAQSGTLAQWVASRNGVGLRIENDPVNSGTPSHARWEHSSTVGAPYYHLRIDKVRQLTVAFVYQHIADAGTVQRAIFHLRGFGTGPGGLPNGRAWALLYNRSTRNLRFTAGTGQNFDKVLSVAQRDLLEARPVPIVVTWAFGGGASLYFDGEFIAQTAVLLSELTDAIDWVMLGRLDLKEQDGANGTYESFIVQPRQWSDDEALRWSSDPHGWMQPSERILERQFPLGPWVERVRPVVPGAEDLGRLPLC